MKHASFFVHRRVYYAGLAASLLFIVSYFYPGVYNLAWLLILCTGILVAVDTLLLYSRRRGLDAFRLMPDRFNNGDQNTVRIELDNAYGFPVHCKLIDEIPFQFQERSWKRRLKLLPGKRFELLYTLQPKERGAYVFGNINVYASSPLRIVERRYIFRQEEEVRVYPSYNQVRRYQLLAAANRLQEAGIKRMRTLGHSLEFEQIKEYVRGDDYRTVNWKATARRGDLMVNNYTDERSQQVYCVINKGRAMKMPFEGMTLLDYAINAALVLSNVALMRQDKAGLITYAQKVDTFIPADKKGGQLNLILEALYREQTTYQDVDADKLFASIRNRIAHRSLIVLFTNFESVESLERDLPSLQRIAHYHLLVVIFFENTELKKLTETRARTTEQIYIKTIADKFAHEKRLMVKELRKQGIVALMATPEQLTVNTINKYLELKNRSSI
jgi:uncharacterized protein (DUF58 family)